MNIIKLIMFTIGIAVFSVVSFYALFSFTRYIDTIAIHDCAQDYKQQIKRSDGTVASRPLEQQSVECAYQKGVANWKGVWSDLPK